MYLIERVQIDFGIYTVFCLMGTAALSLEINQQWRKSLHIFPTSHQLQIARR
jgi:hypothetical protein